METKKRFAGKDYSAFQYSINISFKAEIFQVIKKGGIKNMQTFQVIDIFFIKTEIFYKLLEMLKPCHDGIAAVKRILSVKTVKYDFPFVASFVEKGICHRQLV